MQIRVQAVSNLTQMQAQFAAVTAQVEALNEELARTSSLPRGGSLAGFRSLENGINASNRAWNSALAASGAFQVQTLKINDAISKNTDLLARQKLGFKQTFGKESQAMMKSIYHQQLAMRQAFVKTNEAIVGDGKTRMSLAVPTEVHKSWDTLNNRVGMFRARLASASSELINWGKNTQWAGRQLMAGITFPIAAFGAAAGVMAYQVDKQLTRVVKVYDTTADSTSSRVEDMIAVEKELQQVRTDGMNTAISAAKAYGAAVTDTLDVQAELAATGQRGAELQKATSEVMRIATLGELEHQDAIKTTIALQSVFRMNTAQLADTFNYMNAVENATSLATKDFAQAIPIAAAPIKMFGGDVKELGILLTAMKSRGIEAVQGANALKSAMQRLGRPSAQIQKEFKAITGTDIINLVDTSNSLTEIFQKLRDVTKDLSDPEKRDVFSGLFGSYQVTRMTALVDGMGDLEDGYGQVSRAADIAGQSTQEWADIADREMTRIQESASGKFMRAWQTLRAELAAAGEPFLEVASWALKMTNALLSLFNAMPDWTKKGLAFAAIFAAILGPAVMLVGLMANFSGNIGKLIAWLLKGVSTFEVFTETQIAAQIQQRLVEKGFIKQASAAEVLEAQINALNLALEENAVAMYRAARIPLPVALQDALNAKNPASLPTAPPRTPKIENVPAPPTPAQFTKSHYGALYFDEAGYNKAVAAHKQLALIEADRLRTQGMLNEQAAAEAKIRQTSAKAMNAGVISGAAMAGSMVAMSVSSNEVVDNAAQFVLLASIAVPAFKALGPVLGGVADSFALASSKAFTAAKATTTAAGAGAAFSASIRGAAAGFAGLMGPVGWTITALAAVGFAGYKLYQHQKAITEEINKQNRAIYDQKNLMEGTLDIQVKKQKSLYTPSISDLPNGISVSALAEQMQGDEAMQPIIDKMKNARDETEKTTIATQKYMQVLQASNGDVKKAQAYIEALFVASGEASLEAQTDAQNLVTTLGSSIDGLEQENLWSDLFFQATRDNYGSAEEQGTALGKMFADAVANGTNAEADASMDSMMKAIGQSWQTIFDSTSDYEKAWMKDMGVTTGQAFVQMLRDFQSYRVGDMSQSSFFDAYNIDTDKWAETQSILQNFSLKYTNQLMIANDTEKAMVEELKSQLGITSDITTMSELRNTWEWKLQTATKANRMELYKQRTAAFDMYSAGYKWLTGGSKELTNEMKLQVLNQMRAVFGLGKADELSDRFKRNTGDAADDTDRIAKNLNGLRADIQLSIKDDASGLLQSSMEGVVNDYADAISNNFDSAMQNALDNNQSTWDTAISNLENAQQRAADALDARQEHTMDSFDKRWEARKKRISDYYDSRIDAINKEVEAEQKAEEIRQRIFDAEQARLDRLTESANRTIDFNMALQTGQLDEAAKIANDMDAAAQQWALSDAGTAAGNAAQRRIDRLNQRADDLGEKKDKVIEQLEKEEEARRKALEKRLEMEKNHLEKVQEARMDALREEADADQAALQDQWEARKDELDRELDTFKSFIPKNMKQFKEWTKMMGDEMKNFGTGTLDPLSEKWGSWFKKHFKENMREAGADIASSNQWDSISGQIAMKMLKGMGFPSMNAVERFITTGKLPMNFDSRAVDAELLKDKQGALNPFWHKGGEIGSRAGGSGRNGVARTAGLHPSEQVITARKGEFMVNRDAYRKHSGLVQAINNGTYDPTMTRNGNIMGGATGFAGPMSGIVAMMLAVGIGKAISNAVLSKYQQMQASVGALGAAAPGVYGDISFDATQLRNAGIIASIGKNMGMSARDIAIGIMTSITESGLRNLPFGDRDSAGLFQQRPSQGWGSYSQVTDPEYAARKFFEALRGVANRNNMSPWLAAQTVQRSAYSDGSNYHQYWDEGQAIFAALTAGATGYVPGPGGTHAPTSSTKHGDIHDSYTGFPAVDIPVPTGSPAYAVGNGVVTRSEDLVGDDGRQSNGGYYSYGRVIQILLDGGAEVLYAHLSSRAVREGQRVAGGAIIGRTGNTGHSFGPHLHFGAKGASPLAFLKSGGMTLNDGIAMLHRGETVLTKPLSDDLKSTVNAFGTMSKEILSGRRGGNRASQLANLQAWARGQVGKPYRWGAIGPDGYDCSGLQSAIVSLIKGWPPHQRRLFYTGNMSTVIPNLGFRRGNGGPTDYSVGWRTGDPGHTSGRIGNMGIESTGNAVRSTGATPVGAFPNQWHIPLQSAPAGNPNPPNTGSDHKGDKTPKVPWTKEDGFKSSAESWGPETTPVDIFKGGFWTYLSAMANGGKIPRGKNPKGNNGSGLFPTGNDSGKAFNFTLGTFNTGPNSSPAQNVSDLKRMTPRADILSLQEMKSGYSQIKRYLTSIHWGLIAGGHGAYARDLGLAYDQRKFILEKSGIRKLGDKTANILGGRAKRFAPFALLKDRESGREFWQVAAHMVPTPNFNEIHRQLFFEQWRSLDDLVHSLRETGKPVFVAGDMNIRKDRPWWRTPDDLKGVTGDTVDWIYNDPRMAKLINSGFMGGLHTDHSGAHFGTFHVPSHRDGAENIRWDNTLVNLHKKESVLTDSQSDNFRWVADNIDKIAMGGGNQYNVEVNITEPGADEKQITKAVITALEKHEARKPQKRRS